MSKIITRFAPSPTGHLHIGGARTALFCWLLARHYGGEFRLRIEDTDTERSKQEYTDAILASMRWLGLDWDGELTYQTQRTARYNEVIDKMLESGHAYWCSCTPEEVEAMRETARAKGEKPRYDGRCRERHLDAAPGRVVRLKIPTEGRVVFDDMVKGHIATDVSELDDMILRRSDGMPTYNMAVVVDDHDMGITHVIRGDDHVSNTPKQILIYQALGWELPVFGHVPMILGKDRQKLSKRHGARSVVEYQNDGLLPHALVNCLVRLGWSHGDQELFSMQELIDLFDGKNLNSSASAFDPDKLLWFNAHYLRETPLDDLARLVLPFIHQKGFTGATEASIEPLVPLYRERAKNLIELADGIAQLLYKSADLPYDEAGVAKWLTDEGKEYVKVIRDQLAALPSFDKESIEHVIHSYVESLGVKFNDHIGAATGSLGQRSHYPATPYGNTYIRTFEKVIADSNGKIQVLLDTPAVKLIQNKSGRVVGVVGNNFGSKVTVMAKDGVIIATGGFGANVAYRQKVNTGVWKNIKLDNSIGCTNIQKAAQGQGLFLAQKVGAKLIGLSDIQIHPCGTPGTGLMENIRTSGRNRIFVNSDGNRFVNEGAARDVLANAIFQQKGRTYWIVVNKLRYPTPDFKDRMGASIRNMEALGAVVEAPTLDELAKKTGMNAENLKKAIADYNAVVSGKAKDKLGFVANNKDDKQMTEGPWYACRKVPTVHHTMGGIKINVKSQVINTKGKVIPGLYAVGEVTGGIHGSNRLGGNAIADIMTFGHAVGPHIVQGK